MITSSSDWKELKFSELIAFVIYKILFQFGMLLHAVFMLILANIS